MSFIMMVFLTFTVIATIIYQSGVYYESMGVGGIFLGILVGLFFGIWRAFTGLVGLSIIWPSAYLGLVFSPLVYGIIGVSIATLMSLVCNHQQDRFADDCGETIFQTAIGVKILLLMVAPILAIVSVLIFVSADYYIWLYNGGPGYVIGVLAGVGRFFALIPGAGYYWPDGFLGFNTSTIEPWVLNTYFYALFAFFLFEFNVMFVFNPFERRKKKKKKTKK